MNENTTPMHRRPSSCHVCGDGAEPDTGRPGCAHDYTNADADTMAREYDARTTVRNTEAAYVAQHRPY